jgi:hypothetical protein
MRRKAEPAGARAAGDDAGSRRKLSILTASVKRLGKETNRRRAVAARADLVANVGRALAMKRANARRHRPDPGRTAGRGMRPVDNRRTEEIADPREAGRVSRSCAAQARRDHR